MRSMVIRGMHLVEPFLPRRVPNINFHVLTVDVQILPEHGQRVRRQLLRIVLIHQKAFDELRLADGGVAQQDDFNIRGTQVVGIRLRVLGLVGLALRLGLLAHREAVDAPQLGS